MGAATAGHCREHAMARMTVKGMTLRAHGERMQRRRLSTIDIGGREHGGGFVERIAEPSMFALTRFRLAAQAIARAVNALRDQRHLHRQSPAARLDACRGKAGGLSGCCEHAQLLAGLRFAMRRGF